MLTVEGTNKSPDQPDEAQTVTDSDVRYMTLALKEARLAMESEEVPVGCVIVSKEGDVVATGGNRTTAERNGTRHCEFVAMESLVCHASLSDFKLYVTVEPCIMCAAALRLRGLTEVIYGCANDRFGGCGSIYDTHVLQVEDLPVLNVKGGVLGEEAVALLKEFYERGNPKAPECKRQRPLVPR